MRINPKVSIIVPVYNVEQYLDRCVQSLLTQTFQDIEIILIDDGSPDKCNEICDRYAAENEMIKVIHQANGGVSVARNSGLAIARGKWIAFVDPDDWADSDMIEKLLSVAESENCDICCSGFVAESEFASVPSPIVTPPP